MSELHAAVGLAELRRLPAVVATRAAGSANSYDALVGGLPGFTAVAPVEGSEPNYYKYILVFDTPAMKSDFKAFARSRGLSLPSGVYDVPLHQQPVFEDLGRGMSFSRADHFCSCHAALPVGRTMQQEDVEAVVGVLREFVSQLPALAH